MKRYLPALALGAVLSCFAWWLGHGRVPHTVLSACAAQCQGLMPVLSKDSTCRCLGVGGAVRP